MTDPTTLRDRIAAALMDLGHPQWDAAEGADAVLAVLPATTDQTAEPVCICGHPEARHFEDVCQTCGCGDYLEPRDAAEVIARWRQAALKARADRAAVLREAADAVDSGKAPFPNDVKSGASWAARMLRRMADETQPAETEPEA